MASLGNSQLANEVAKEGERATGSLIDTVEVTRSRSRSCVRITERIAASCLARDVIRHGYGMHALHSLPIMGEVPGSPALGKTEAADTRWRTVLNHSRVVAIAVNGRH